MIVMKFGGTSVGSAERLKAVADIVGKYKEKNPVVVVSAVGGITDKLIEAANAAVTNGRGYVRKIEEKHNEILNSLGLEENMLDELFNELRETMDTISRIKDCQPKMMDLVCSFGERMSSRIVAAYLKSIGLKSNQYDAYDIGFLTDSNFGSAELLQVSYEKIKQSLSDVGSVSVVTGFIAKNEKGQITTLGRGGSDYTAAVIGAAIDAEEIQIWTDVDGIMTADPKVVDNVRTIEKITFQEAAELATFGARVLHPKTILPAVKKDIPVKVLNSFNPEHTGTTIVKDCEPNGTIIRSIASKKDITLLNVNSTRMLLAHGFMSRLFHTFERYNVSIDMISTSEVSVSLTLNKGTKDEDIQKIAKDLEGVAEICSEKDKAIICLVGKGMHNTIGVIARIFKTISENGINVEMVSQGASEINVGFVVDVKDREKAVQCLHKEYFG